MAPAACSIASVDSLQLLRFARASSRAQALSVVQ
jgi:hypothetical protein